MQKAKVLYFTVFVLAVMAFIFHATAMGHHHWKYVEGKNITETGFNRTTIGLFTRCVPSDTSNSETCFPNTYPIYNISCRWYDCQIKTLTRDCGCDFLPSTKGIAACAIIAAIFLGISIILLFIHSIKTSDTRAAGLLLSFLPLALLLLAFIFILITLILIGTYLSRDIITIFQTLNRAESLENLRIKTAQAYHIRIDWASGLEIIALVLTFFSFILYCLFIFKVGR